MPQVYFTELQRQIGLEAFYDMYIQYLRSGHLDDINEEDQKKVDACKSAIEKLGGLV